MANSSALSEQEVVYLLVCIDQIVEFLPMAEITMEHQYYQEREREREIRNEKFNVIHYTDELVYIQGAVTTK